MTDNDIISLKFQPDLSQLAGYVTGYEHQSYENYRMIYGTSWDAYFLRLRTDWSLWSGATASMIYAISLPWVPGVWPILGYWVFAPAPFVALAVWCILWRGEKKSAALSNEQVAEWNMRHERMYCEHYEIEIGPEGFCQISRLDNVKLSWARYHLAILQPDNLVLVFHGMVAVIPNNVLPIAPKEVVEKIHSWSIAQQEKIRPLA